MRQHIFTIRQNNRVNRLFAVLAVVPVLAVLFFSAFLALIAAMALVACRWWVLRRPKQKGGESVTEGEYYVVETRHREYLEEDR
ncbi:MAG: hypothetical protein ACREUA_07385 [Burkholderiales bacterium]